MKSGTTTHRAARTRTIQRADEVEWEFVYSDSEEESDAAMERVLDIIMNLGEENGLHDVKTPEADLVIPHSL